MTYPLRRTTLSFNRDYTACLVGFGNELATKTEPENIFIGLSNLYHLLNQASYENLVYMSWNGGTSEAQVIFNNFTLGSSSTLYSISYSSAIEDMGGATTGFYPGTRFSASGMDVNGCASMKHAPGWYDAQCVGPSVFADQLGWQINSVFQTLDWFDFNINRQSAYYDSPGTPLAG